MKFFFPDFEFIKEDYLKKRIKFTNTIYLLSILITFSYALIYYFLDNFGFLFYSSIGIFVLFCLGRVLLFYKKYNVSRSIVLLVSNFNLFLITSATSLEFGFHLFFLPLCLMPILIFDFREKKQIITNGSIGPILLGILYFTDFNFSFISDLKLDLNLNHKLIYKQNLLVSILAILIAGIYFTFQESIKDSEIEEKSSILKNSRINLETMLDSIHDALVIINKEYKILESNSLFQVYFNEVLGENSFEKENFLDYIETFQDRDEIKVSIQKTFAGFFIQKVFKIKNYFFEFSFSPVLIDLSVKSIIILIKNITEIKEYQNEIIDSKDDILALVSSLDDMIFELDENFLFVNVWTKNDNFLLAPKEKIIGKKIDEFFSPDISKTCLDHLNILLYSKIPQILEYKIAINSEEKWFQAKLSLFYKEKQKSPCISILVRDITDRKLFITELIEAKEIAEKAKKLESEFLSTMSHEIRTPLYGLIGLIEIVEKEKNPIKVKENIELMKYSAGNLLSIVNDILDLSKIENGIIDIKSEKFNLKEIVETAFKTVESLIKENEVLLEFNFDESIPEFLNGDSLRLNQIFLNLLTNSAKFTAFGKIEFNIKKLIEENEQIQIQFEVNDTGIGIEENQLNQLFLPYSQEKNTNHRLKGTGLGLTITKKLVELLNGKIEVQSKVHFGTSFKILIPFNTSNELSNQSNLVEPYEVFQTKFKDLEILLVDDYETNLFVGKEILSLWNIIVDTATNGLEALEKTKLKKYDTILMDIQMPNLSGDETANLIKSDKENLNFNTPIIALSADVFNDVKERAIKAGMKGFVNKPFQLRELAEAISKNLKN